MDTLVNHNNPPNHLNNTAGADQSVCSRSSFHTTLPPLLLLVFLLFPTISHAQTSPTLSLIDNPETGALIVREHTDSHTTDVLHFNYAPQLPPDSAIDPTYRRSTYIHPLFSLDGHIITDDFPADHPHHHGIWWGWPLVNTRGTTVSNWAPTTPSLHHHFIRLTDKQEGQTLSFTTETDWVLDTKTTVAKEWATITIHPRQPHSRRIEIDLKIDALGGPLTLQGAPEQNKGYGGLSFRGAPDLKRVPILTDEGSSDTDLVYVTRRWISLATPQYGIRFTPHSSYPSYPPRWLARNSYAGYISLSWPGLPPVTLDPATPVNLRHEIIIHRPAD